MKYGKKVVYLLPLLIFIFTFGIVYVFNKSYAIYSDTAPDVAEVIKTGTIYQMTKKNIYSWHLITHNFNSFSSTNASGTKYLKTKSEIDGKKYSAVVYCASEGKVLGQSQERKRYPIDHSAVKKHADWKKSGRITKIKRVMPYMYPYIPLGATSSDVGTLKDLLKNGSGSISGLSGSKYTDYGFDSLTVQEAVTAVQAAIWNIQKGKTASNVYYTYRGTISSFSAFDSAAEYHNGKIITSEEARWWNEECNTSKSTCPSSSKYQKLVVNHKKTDNTKNRINTLIKWYLNLAEQNIDNNMSYFNVESSSFDSSTNILTVIVDTNLSSYTLKFTNNTTELTAVKEGTNTYKVTVPGAANTVEWNVSSTATDTTSLYYYRTTSGGQDMIGLEHGVYTNGDTINIVRTAEKGKLIIYKVTGASQTAQVVEQTSNVFEPERCNTSASGCLSEAKFILYYENKTDVFAELELDYSSSETISESVMLDNIPPGTYYLKEVQPPAGFDLYDNGSSGVSNDGFITVTIQNEKTYAIIVNNNKTHVCFIKFDGTNTTKILNNAVYEIQDIDGSVLEEFETSELETNGHCLDGQLDIGSYFIREVKAPNGYTLDRTKYHFTVGKGISDLSDLEDVGEYTNISPVGGAYRFTNKMEVAISKSDATTGECVSGAKLTIRDSSNQIVKDSNGIEIGSWISKCDEGTTTPTTDENLVCIDRSDPTNVVQNEEAAEDNPDAYICTDTAADQQDNSYKITLAPGTYTLTEEMTPELKAKGYSSEPETISFTVDENGKVDAPVEMKDEPIKVCIYKVSKDKKTPLAGAQFKIYDENGNLKKEFTTSSEPTNNCMVRDLPIGTYKIKEVKAPNGYKALNEEIKIEVKDTKDVQNFYIENEIIAPKTAMNAAKLVTIIALIFMMFGFGMVGYYVIKREN